MRVFFIVGAWKYNLGSRGAQRKKGWETRRGKPRLEVGVHLFGMNIFGVILELLEIFGIIWKYLELYYSYLLIKQLFKFEG